MGKDDLTNIEEQISKLLKKTKQDYLTVAQVRQGLPADSLKHCGLTRKSSSTAVLKRLKPHFGSRLQDYKGRSTYIGFKMPLEEIIFNKIKQNPGLSSKQAGKNIPMIKKTYISLLNELLKSGSVICTFNEYHTPSLRITDKVPLPTAPKVGPAADRAAFKKAYDNVGKGRSFVRIHRIREFLQWPRDRFDGVLTDLMADYTIELHTGDPSIMTEKEIQDSFMGENGILYLTMTWWGHE
ncbi:MAG: hypothetical protein JRG73_05365 [Deltaproteobacteria bacterium]|nr:hypothetical protein [Deltaproteobacteria bacterium]